MNFLRRLFNWPTKLYASKRLPRPGVRTRPPQPTQPTATPAQPAAPNPIDYVMNDMTTPELVKKILPPAPPQPNVAIQRYAGGGFPRGTPENLAANCHVTIANTLNLYKSHLARPLTRWAGCQTLTVIPMAGTNLNAFYDRRSLQFFYYGHRRIGGTVYTAESSDIVAHELGHAILDSLRPDTWNAASMEVWAYHESFADWSAMFHIMSYDEVLDYVIKQTAGDLRKPNVIAQIAEHIGRAIYEFTGPQSGRNPLCLRTAINNYKYVNPSSLPKDGPANILTAEPHSFGQLFLGTFYDLLVEIYESQRNKINPLDALKYARDALGKRVIIATQNAGMNTHFYESVGRTLLWADKTQFKGEYQEIIRTVLVRRKIIQPDVKILSAPVCQTAEKIMMTPRTLSLRLSDGPLNASIRAQAANPLYDVEIEVPHDQTFLYDEDGQIMDVVAVSDDEAIDAAREMVDYLHSTNKVSDSPDTPFEIRDGKLVRTHFS